MVKFIIDYLIIYGIEEIQGRFVLLTKRTSWTFLIQFFSMTGVFHLAIKESPCKYLTFLKTTIYMEIWANSINHTLKSAMYALTLILRILVNFMTISILSFIHSAANFYSNQLYCCERCKNNHTWMLKDRKQEDTMLYESYGKIYF